MPRQLSVQIMATILARRTPLSHRQLTFLQAHILRQRKKTEANSLLEDHESYQKESDLKVQTGDETLTLDSDIKPDHPDQSDRGETTKEAEAESTEDIASQIEAHLIRLESLREEKHRLFQQLKMVLHEEDERKRLKEEEQKQELDKSLGGVVSNLDPRLNQSSVGLKRPLPVSPPIPLHGSQDPPVKKVHRAPLLPTPDASAGIGGSGGSLRHFPGEGYHNSPRQHYPPGTHVGQLPPFPDQRFGPGPHDSHIIAHPQANLQAGMVQHPTQLYGSTQTLPYQYASSSSPYGTISGVQPPSSQTSQLHYQQVPQFMHPHEVSLQGQYIPSFGHGQPHPHEVNLAPVQQPHELTQMQGHAHFGAQGVQLGSPCHTNNLHGVSYTGHIQDPRHQKVLDQHRSTSSPTQLSKQESYTSSVGSPSSPVPASRERKPRK